MSIIIKLQVGLGFFFICNSAKLYFNPETYITLVYTSLFNLIGMFYRNKLILIKFTLIAVYCEISYNDRNKHIELWRRGIFEKVSKQMNVFYLEYHERFYIQKLSFTKVKKKRSYSSGISKQ